MGFAKSVVECLCVCQECEQRVHGFPVTEYRNSSISIFFPIFKWVIKDDTLSYHLNDDTLSYHPNDDKSNHQLILNNEGVFL
jgi:hypothetical protein